MTTAKPLVIGADTATDTVRAQRHRSGERRLRRGFPGAKPDGFCFWMFEGLNLTPEDEFHDLFPGSGAVGEAWEKWKAAHGTPEQFDLEAT